MEWRALIVDHVQWQWPGDFVMLFDGNFDGLQETKGEK